MSGLFGSGRSGGGLAGGLSGGLKMAAVALLVHQLMKHSRSSTAGAPGAGSAGGGLGGLLGGLFGGGGTASGASQPGAGQAGGLGGLLGGGGLGGLLGGLGGMLGGLRSHGLSQEVDSWVAPGPNRPVSPEQLRQAFDPQELDEIARRAGTDRDSLLEAVSQVLPRFVDSATPQGRLPQDEQEAGGDFSSLLDSLSRDEQDQRRSPGPSR